MLLLLRMLCELVSAELRCIFCKGISTDSKSVEHIIPESLGNTASVLPKGAVCDSCNNYFATKVEKPVLESSEFVQLRFNQLIRSKKGRVPKTDILVGPHIVNATRNDRLDFSFDTDDFNKIEKYIESNANGEIMIPVTGEPPSDHFISRFLAKMALEALTFRWLDMPNWNDYVVDHSQLDLIRKFTRYPKRGEVWSFSKRRIYDENNSQLDSEGNNYQLVNEWDILVTSDINNSEFYFVIAIFGMEYAINLGGNSIDGYNHWLSRHANHSPLYHGKNIT